MKRLLVCIICFIISGAVSAAERIVVAQDGSGNYKTVQEAINAVQASAIEETVIFIKRGVYKEKLIVPVKKQKIHFIGEGALKTKLTYDDFASKKDSAGHDLRTSGSASFYVYGADFTAESITFENTAGAVGQALAVYVASDRSKFINCRFLGFQDTIYTHKRSRQYYQNCYIEGATDFIFGPAVAVFDNCEIFCKKGGQYFTAASTDENEKFGYVFFNCRITGNAPASSYYLGRPWKPFAKVVFMKCDLGEIIKPEGWYNWDNPANEKTAYYAEYKNKGKGFKPDERVAWSHQLTDEEAKEYTIVNIFKGWNPLTSKSK